MTNYQLGNHFPKYSKQSSTYLASSCEIIGNVCIGADVSIWSCAIIRGDHEPIHIGNSTNIQEHSMLHTDIGFPLSVGDFCTIGHRVILHGCSIGDHTLIGMGSVILNGAKIGKYCLVGAGSLVTMGKEFPDGSLIMGSPARLIRRLESDERAALTTSALAYVENARRMKTELSVLSDCLKSPE
jgi:carbonic anhydrase/acetyltransferase-like protein (isoleucine patch superfamily)